VKNSEVLLSVPNLVSKFGFVNIRLMTLSQDSSKLGLISNCFDLNSPIFLEYN